MTDHPPDADLLMDVIGAAQQLMAACDRLGQHAAGDYISLAIGLLRDAPGLDRASVFREAEADPFEGGRRQLHE